MSVSLDQSVESLRAAVAARMAATPADDPKMVGYRLDQGDPEPGETYAEWTPAFQKYRPGTDSFIAVLEELRELHLRKTLDYGVDEDALANIRNSADVINVPAYAACVLRMADKMQRLRAFFRRGQVEFDGVEDTLLDIAAYAAIALVVYREHRRG